MTLQGTVPGSRANAAERRLRVVRNPGQQRPALTPPGVRPCSTTRHEGAAMADTSRDPVARVGDEDTAAGRHASLALEGRRGLVAACVTGALRHHPQGSDGRPQPLAGLPDRSRNARPTVPSARALRSRPSSLRSGRMRRGCRRRTCPAPAPAGSIRMRAGAAGPARAGIDPGRRTATGFPDTFRRSARAASHVPSRRVHRTRCTSSARSRSSSHGSPGPARALRAGMHGPRGGSGR